MQEQIEISVDGHAEYVPHNKVMALDGTFLGAGTYRIEIVKRATLIKPFVEEGGWPKLPEIPDFSLGGGCDSGLGGGGGSALGGGCGSV